jgi:accessory gene regulator protein AgrB
MNLVSFYIAFHDPIWVVLLSTVLFFPVRKLIWVLYVRKKQKSQKVVSEEEKKILKKRATFTSVLLCIVFSYIYVNQVFN